MLKLGKKQELEIVKKVDFGVYLAEPEGHSGAHGKAAPSENERERVLLPAKQVPEGAETGDRLAVFLYRDSSDRLIATTAEPALTLDQVGLLTVADVGKIGAFLDWGLEKDLLLPFREQTKKVQKGEQVLVALYIDKSSRLCATMKLYPYLKTQSPYQIGDQVQGRVYETGGNFGIFVAVEDKFSAMIPKKEAQGRYQAGEVLNLRVTEVREDGKLGVSPRGKAYQEIGGDAEKILEMLREQQGVLPFDDKASPALIAEKTGLSKAAFKRAVGHLLKEKSRLKAGKN